MALINSIISKKTVQEILDADKAITLLDESTLKYIKTLGTLKDITNKAHTTIKQVEETRKKTVKTVKNLTDIQKENQRLTKSFLTTEAKVARATSDTNKGLVAKKIALQKTTQELKLLSIVENKETGTLDRLRAQVRLNALERGKLNLKTKEGRKRLRELNRETNKANSVIAKSSDLQTKAKIGIGKYAQGIKSAALQMTGLAGGMFIVIKLFRDGIKTVLEFEKALSSLSAITGATGEDLDFLKDKAIELSKESLQSASNIVKAFELVGSIRPELLKDGEALAGITKQVIILSEASGGVLTLEDAAKALTGTMNQFNIVSSDAAKATDILVAAQTFGSATVKQLSESFKNFGTVAADSNLTLIQGAALTETVAGKMINEAEAGTKLTSTLINLKKAGVGYASGQFNISDALREVKDEIDSLDTAYEKDQKIIETFGKLNITVGTILLNNIDTYESLTKQLDVNGIAVEKQITQNDNLASSLTGLGNSWDTLLIKTTGDSTGGIKGFVDLIKFNIDLLTGQATLFGETEEEATKLTKEEQAKRLASLKTQNEAIIQQITTEGERLKELYAEDFTNFDDVIQQKEGAKLKYLFSVSSGVEKEIAELEKLNEKDLEEAKRIAEAKAIIDKQIADAAIAENKRKQDEIDKQNKKADAKLNKRIEQSADAAEKELDLILGFADKKEQAEIDGFAKSVELSKAATEAIIADKERLIESQILVMRSKGKSEEEINEFIFDLNQSALEQFIENAELELETIEGNNELKLELRQELDDAELELDKIKQDRKDKTDAETLLKQKQLQQALIQIFTDTGNAIFELSRNNRDKQQIDAQRLFDYEVGLAGDNADEKEKAEIKYANATAEIKRKQAEADKRQALFNIAIQTAQNIIDLWLTPPLAIAAGIAGALQAAIVLSTPIPQFAKGLKGGYSGPGIWGEKGTELKLNPGGDMELSSGPTLSNIKSGTKIISNPELMGIVRRAKDGGTLGYDTPQLRQLQQNNAEGFRRLEQAIINKKEYHFDKHGRKIGERSGKYYKSWHSRKIAE